VLLPRHEKDEKQRKNQKVPLGMIDFHRRMADLNTPSTKAVRTGVLQHSRILANSASVREYQATALKMVMRFA
jgi:hypothetical protein